MNITWLLFLMITLQGAAYLWFQSKGGLVSHRKFIFVNVCLMAGQAAQSIESFTKDAYASFSIATFFFIMTGFGAVRRHKIMKKESRANI